MEERVRDTNRVVGVLSRNGFVSLAFIVRVVTRCNKRRYFIFFLHLPLDEVNYFRMVEVETNHFSGTSGGATALDSACCCIANLQEAHQSRGSSSAGKSFAFASDIREVSS